MPKKREVVADTSALLSLQSGDLLRQIGERYTLLVTESVVEELQDFARHDDELGDMAREILRKGEFLDVRTVRTTEEIPEVESTDNEVYNLALEEELMLMTDDVKLCRKIEKVETAFSTYFLGFLVESDELTTEEALEKLRSMRDRRNWKENMIYLTTRKELEKLL
ncbi:hypothetical protein AKJ66_02775 [candidate division MSBL1 archaeon SCGC-AAA259E22]|uniref:PIN domain-containing protein n=2 Tax=candidate division MSBL1 TaxID=215777 RepID=A0A133U4L9_9EURY|nr:hypothetical protein AKJ61_03520 [candidate division MSBL1 archaeon SCGC-AAA259B11]KXA93096.1 hypothetical protein AKJ66_02775 [candidate division MSBL1 archaeon SCGC-AAA259E22]